MIISNVSNICAANNYTQQAKVNKYNLCQPQKMNTKNDVSFTGGAKLYLDMFASKLYDPLKKVSQYSPDEYSSLSKLDLKILRSRYKHLSDSSVGGFFKNAEVIHDKVSDVIKKGLDEKYGENGYKVVTIGRSLSSIGKVLSYKIGKENVINIPMSYCQRYTNPAYIDLIEKEGKIKPLEYFLRTKGLSQESVENSDKKLVLMDYCCTGDSLTGAKDLFKRIYHNSQNIVSANPENLIDDKFLRKSFSQVMVSSCYKQFSFVSRTRYLSDIRKSFVDTQKADYKSRLMWFKLLDNFVSNNKTNLNEVQSDYWNLLSIKV